MKSKIILITFFIISFFLHAVTYAQSQGDVRKLFVFHSLSCHRCIEIKSTLIPTIEKEFKGSIEIVYYDINDIENYKLLLGLRERYNSKGAIVLPVFFLGGEFLNGSEAGEKNLERFIKGSLGSPALKIRDVPAADLAAHFKSFVPLAIVSAGLIDGINPCAFTVIVFFISFLATQGYRKRDLTAIGMSFIAAVFVTYFCIGLGLFGFLYSFKGFGLIIRLFNFTIGIFSIVLGIFCIYDFFKFKKTREYEGLFLQLPQSVKNQIHKVIGLHYRRTDKNPQETASHKRVFRLMISALITGFLVSILEAICTGQTYLPTLAFVLKTTEFRLQALGYLLLYNLMFIVPLFVIFIFALLGVTSVQFSEFLKKNMLTIKILMAVLFLSLGVFLIWRV